MQGSNTNINFILFEIRNDQFVYSLGIDLKNETSPNTTKNHSEKFPQHTVLHCACTAATSDDELGENIHDPFRQALS
jgi:hypothetical protein